jgi:hypothetical protein
LDPKFGDYTTMCALEERQHGNQSWIDPSLYGGGTIARDLKEGHFFLLEKRSQSQYGERTTQSDGVKTIDNEYDIWKIVSTYFESLHPFIAHNKNYYSCVQLIFRVIERYKK